jgi:hypothetical protein
MKKLILTIAAGIMIIGCFAQVNESNTYVNGYYKKDGTYVDGHYRTTSNNTNQDNYTTKPNVNPYTGKNGTVEPDNSYYNSKSSTKTNTGNAYSYPTYNYSGKRKK